jgi:hypothetical protein
MDQRFVNSHFKPFCAIGFEYNKCRTNSGVPQFGSTVQFSIPQFGDFFSDMVAHTILSPAQATLGTIPTFGTGPGQVQPIAGSTFVSVSATSQVYGHDNFPAAGTYTQYTQEFVDAAGNVLTTGTPARNYVRYAEYVGERLFRKVGFEVNGNPLDEYTAEAMFFHRKFKLAPNKVTGWKRLVGQEVPVEAYSDVLSFAPYGVTAGAGPWNAANLNLLTLAGSSAPGAPVSPAVTARKLVSVVSGYQTPQQQQPALDLWIPLIFWFNRDSRLSIPSVSIPFGQRYITMNIEQQANLLFTAPGNLFLRLTVQEQFSAGGAAGTAAALAVTDVKTYVSSAPFLLSNSTVDPSQTFNSMELYINNIFVNPEIHDIYIRRIGFTLIRVNRLQVQPQNTNANNVLLSNLKWPVEYMMVGLRPAVNVSAANPNQYRDWHRLSLPSDNVLETVANASSATMIDNTVAFNAVSPFHKTASSRTSVEKMYFPSYTQTVDTLQLQVHGINIFEAYPDAFFRDYQTFTFGGSNINTPEDTGAYFVNFCLYPGTYQPSGHINTSRTREFYLNYVSSYVTSSTPADLIVLASAINFLLISDGSAVLRLAFMWVIRQTYHNKVENRRIWNRKVPVVRRL